LLARLAGDCGIQTEYHDIWGRLRHAPEETLRALLEAFGVIDAAASTPALRAALVARAEARWSRWIEPVVVASTEQTALSVRVNVPAFVDQMPLRWQIEAEDGSARGGEFIPARGPELERAQVGDTLLIARTLRIESMPPAGYHRLNVFDAEGRVRGTAQLLVAPPRCYCPPAVEQGRRLWGPGVQLYSVRSERNWGIGDFTDLASLVELWGRRGADLVGINPLHALYPHNPRHASPYSPSSRLFRNVLYLDVEAIAEFAACGHAQARVRSPSFQEKLTALRHAPLVDYEGVRALKFEIFELLFACWRAAGSPDAGRVPAFADFVRQGGAPLRQHALFEALQEHLHALDPARSGWQAWPVELQDPAGSAVQRFAEEHGERIAFYQYLQWQAELQLHAVAQRARDAGMAIGLYADLAVSVDGGGSECWSNRAVFAHGLHIGAPPDDYNLKGQDWGEPPWNPEALRAAGHAPFIAQLRANMRHAGALRIDHVMALMRLYLLAAAEADATRGTYVHYPFDELLAAVAIESHRHCCLVIGEDLGTVPEVVRTSLAKAGVLSYRLLYFERDIEHDGGGAFRSPADYPAQAIVAASTHDLPTLAGWWEGKDLALRAQLDLFPTPEQEAAQQRARREDRELLLRALAREQLLPKDVERAPGTPRTMDPALAGAIHAYLMRSRAALAVVQPEDMFGVIEQTNLPGTTDRHPNWRRRLPLPLEHWEHDSRFRALVALCAAERPRAPAAQAAPVRARAATVIPRATYRLQLGPQMTFAQATELVPYLADLGISHVYCSPYLRARAGSQHGYDIIDHNTLNPEIGTRTDFDRFVARLRQHGMGQIADVVPNHMGVLKADNAWWLDVLENGPASAFAHYFDIDWEPRDPELRNKVLLPVLGEHYGRVLERGELTLDFDAATGSLSVRYFEHRFPLDPCCYPQLLERALQRQSAAAPPLTASARAELTNLIEALRQLPPRDAASAQLVARRRRDKETLKHRLLALVTMHPEVGQAVASALAHWSGRPGDAASFEALHQLLEVQAYRLASWRVAADEINYRRFFDINDLAALRMEEQDVFEATHARLIEWAAAGAIDGLRIDHPDGLFDPAQYFARLQQAFARATGRDADERPLYVVIEKIVASHEEVPLEWPVYGTTGYRFATLINGLFIDSANKARVDRTWRGFLRDEAQDFADIAYQARREVMAGALTSELAVLSNRLLRLARADRRTRDFTFNALRQALATVVACFPVYRTYIATRPTRQDRRYIDWAIGQARRRSRAADASIFDFVRNVLLARAPGAATQRLKAEVLNFARRFQQFTAPVAAKGIEDTAFYRFTRLLSLNEVGADPEEFGMSVAAWHAASGDRRARWQHTMLATSTHDTKRSEDVRNRLNVISEVPAAWRLALRRWSRINRRHRRIVDGRPAPSRSDEYALYQLLAGTCPRGELDDAQLGAWRGRIETAALKGAREAKLRTSWINPNGAYEQALRAFVAGLLAQVHGNLFLDDLRAQSAPLAWYGLLNSVSTALLKFVSPGMPDLYQGNEMLSLRLVDPDNRAPVDFEACRAALARLQALAAEDDVAARLAALFAGDGGLAKLWTTWRTLALRRERRTLFEDGDYVPLAVQGARAAHIVAFGRRDGAECGLVIAGRLFATLAPVDQLPLGEATWGDTAIDLAPLGTPGKLFDQMSGATLTIDGTALPLARAWTAFPGALLVTF
jgi:(1->4)-alpha-D-glucan 1-alpha-D-glucosylmutase